MEKTATEAGNSASGGRGWACWGRGLALENQRAKGGYRVSPLSEAPICKRPTMILIFSFLFGFFFFLRHILHIYPEIHCVAQVSLKFKVLPLPPAQVLDYRHAQTRRTLTFLNGKVKATEQMPEITKWSIRMGEVEKGSSPHSAQPGQREGEGGPAGVMGSSGRPPVAGCDKEQVLHRNIVQQLPDPSPSLFMGLIYFYPPPHSFS